MKRAFPFLSILLLCALAPAYVITFDDLTLNDTYNVGDSFISGGVQITGEEFFWYPSGSTIDGFAKVRNNGDAGGTGYEMWLNNINLDFGFEMTPLQGLSLQYGYYGGNVNLEINGVLKNLNDGFTSLHGTTVGGVTIAIVDTGSTGAIFVTGPISSFSIGGQELAIDTVIACIPEPATLGLLSLGAVLLRRKK